MTSEPTQQIGFLRLNKVLELIPVSKTTWYEGIEQGRFPKPTKISANISVWRKQDIYNLIEKMGGHHDS